jgi:GntR family transcriptional regulator
VTSPPRPAADPVNRPSLPERLREVWRDAAGEGSLMPGEPALAELLGVSRPALREAMVRLAAEGLIDRRQGAGTAVNLAALEMPIRLDRQTPFETALANAGYATSQDLIESGPVQLDDIQAERLRLPIGSPALRTVKRWRADGAVAMVAVDLLPVPEGADVADVDPQPSVFVSTIDLHGHEAVWEPAWPRACVVDRRLSRWLELPVGSPVLTLDVMGISRSGFRCYLATEYHVMEAVPQGLIRCLVP